MFGLYTLRISEERYLKVDSFIQSSFQTKISSNRNIFRIVSHEPQCCNIEVQSVSVISYTFILISNFSYSTTAVSYTHLSVSLESPCYGWLIRLQECCWRYCAFLIPWPQQSASAFCGFRWISGLPVSYTHLIPKYCICCVAASTMSALSVQMALKVCHMI